MIASVRSPITFVVSVCPTRVVEEFEPGWGSLNYTLMIGALQTFPVKLEDVSYQEEVAVAPYTFLQAPFNQGFDS